MEKVVNKMKEAGLSQAAIDAFKQNYEQLVAGVTGLVSAKGANLRLVSCNIPLAPDNMGWISVRSPKRT